MFATNCQVVVIDITDSDKNGHCAKEKYWNSTSRQTILGKLHPAGVAV